jgi:hypothetical protein
MCASGHLVMEDNLLTIDSSVPRLAVAVLVMGQDTPELRRNRLQNVTGRRLALLLDWASLDPVLEGNQVKPGDAGLSTGGLRWHRASVLYHGSNDGVRAFAGQVKRGLMGLAGR